MEDSLKKSGSLEYYTNLLERVEAPQIFKQWFSFSESKEIIEYLKIHTDRMFH